MVRASGGEWVQLGGNVWPEQRTSKGKVEDTGAPDKGHRKTSKDSWGIDEGIS